MRQEQSTQKTITHSRIKPKVKNKTHGHPMATGEIKHRVKKLRRNNTLLVRILFICWELYKCIIILAASEVQQCVLVVHGQGPDIHLLAGTQNF